MSDDRVKWFLVRLRGFAALAIFLALPGVGLAQRVSVGGVGGWSLNTGFDANYLPGIPGRTGADVVLPNSRSYLLGPAAEVRLTDRFAFEAAALYKPLHYKDAPIFEDGSIVAMASNTVVTWQYPLLLRYRAGGKGAHPFVEAGPSLRSAGNLNRADPSHFGLTAGGGVELPIGKVRFSPSVRYTRWRNDATGLQVRTRSDQLEFLIGAHYGDGNDGRPLGRKVRVGSILGSTLTDHSPTHEYTSFNPDGSFLVFETTPRKHALAVGAKVEAMLNRRVSIEVDGLPRSFRSVVRVVRSEGDVPIQRPTETTSGGIWEFPVLVKYRLAQSAPIRPLLEAGPSFRTPKEIGSAKLSTLGVTAGIGVEAVVGPVRIEPAVRFTHWGPDGQVSSGSDMVTGIYRNQIQIALGLAF